MEKPVLVIMAAGMGSRYGGLKQIDPMDEQGQLIIDFSLFDAKRAGFEKVVFIIKKVMEEEFKEVIGRRMERQMEVSYAYQELDALPNGFTVPEGREKPWGTAQALLSTVGQVKGPFAVINADDYYGPQAFRLLYDYLSGLKTEDEYRYCMVGYQLKNTVTEHGSVARGICRVDERNQLLQVTERTNIVKGKDGIAFSEDGGQNWTELDGDTWVSMNMWGFTPDILREIGQRFPSFLEKELPKNPLKCEYYLPSAVSALLEAEKAQVQVLHSGERWYGVTYRQDKAAVTEAISRMKEEGIYPEKLWEDN